ncbi:DNA polymerase, beta domain protein region [Psychromonas ingrahamii 37]|uniref:DNA polymerase, beta domain protein region n=1 Tax=Psychromonas ingrahamii (strain DSM 17664 / CCUG 51855 / 37) TaxID=357804 RepID=A2BNC5_PSYIN|nr:nucleotidyltransferase domain-containing protein [Psychromonas ingrahamii]ABM79880.1 DNA polymerase, beta domain protein region [Psychromonas ingrahamii 37]
MPNQADLLAAIQRLAANNQDISVVWLYGSRAADNFKSHSDFDIAIAFKNFKLSVIDKYLRPNELAIDWAIELGLPSEMLSIVDINQAPIYLAYNIIEDGQVIYETQTSRVYRERNRIYSQYEHQIIENAKNEK